MKPICTAGDQIEAIVRALTPAQRAALLWCNADGAPRAWRRPAPREVSFWALRLVVRGDPAKEISTSYALVSPADHATERAGIWPARTWALTPLGRSVRKRIEIEEAKHA